MAGPCTVVVSHDGQRKGTVSLPDHEVAVHAPPPRHVELNF
jgi:hypothetical protein